MSYHFPPRQMRVASAAFYCGVSEQTFLDRVRAGTYPAGVRDGGCRVWLRDDLDAMIDRLHGVSAGGVANDGGRSGSWSRFSKAG